MLAEGELLLVESCELGRRIHLRAGDSLDGRMAGTPDGCLGQHRRGKSDQLRGAIACVAPPSLTRWEWQGKRGQHKLALRPR